MKKITSFIKKEKKFVITICILFLGNGLLYWLLKLFQHDPVYIHYYLDDKIPFWGWLVYIYNLFYPFCLLAFFLLYLKDKKTYFKGAIACTIGFLICDIIFLFIPTIMYRPVTPNYDPITNFLLKVTFFFDEPPLNCFPSLHCLFCFQVIYSYTKSSCTIKRKTWIIIMSLLIIASTLFVKQHYIYDVIAALLVCIISNMAENIFGIYERLKKKKIL